jgi:phage shock protein E
MNVSDIQQYALPLVVTGFFIWRFIRFKMIKAKIPELIKSGAIIVDVRSKSEFASGSSAGSINIPLNEIDQSAGALDPTKTIVLCCASGTRSAMAAASLRRKGFKKVINAGPWSNTVT